MAEYVATVSHVNTFRKGSYKQGNNQSTKLMHGEAASLFAKHFS